MTTAMPGSRKKVLVLGILTLFLMTGMGGAWLALGNQAARIPTIPAEFQAAVDFPLYYPEELPEGYVVDKNSFSTNGSVVTYSIMYQKDDKLLVSLQPRPANFDFDAFYQKALKNSQTVSTGIGTARIGQLNGTETVSLLADKTWILITTPDGVDTKALIAITKSFNEAETRS